MKNSNLKVLIFALILVNAVSCKHKQVLILKPPTDSLVYAIKVDDASEIDVLHQQLHLNIIRVQMPLVYFHVKNNETLKLLIDAGYSQPVNSKPEDAYNLSVKLVGKYDAERLKGSGVSVINNEPDHLLVYGSIAKLQALKNAGFNLQVTDYEIRPREIKVTVKEQDIQHVYDLGVDIFTAVKDSGNYTIYGSAFDFQIDSIRNMKYRVTILKSKI
jgi:hypothetical protein